MSRWGPFILIVLLAAGAASAIERFPPPEFTDHALPTTETPPPPADLEEYVDLGVLVAALAVASYLALGVRRRRALVVLAIFSLGYFGFWRQGCVCPIGATQNIVRSLFESGYLLPWTVVAIFSLPLVAALFFGRSFCAAVCPLGAVQDLVLVRPVALPGWLAGTLRMGAYLYLGAAVLFAATGSAFIICQYDPFVGFFRLSDSINMIVLGVCVVLIAMFIARPYCRFACPYGVLLGWLSRLSWRRVTITPDECVKCRLCEDSCPFGAIRQANADRQQPPRTEGKGLLVGLLALLLPLGAGGGALGWHLRATLARMHPTVRLAGQIRMEENDEVKVPTDATKAFRGSGRKIEDLYADEARLLDAFALGGAAFGAFIGLVVGGKLVALSVRRRREEYEADRGSCLACGRCFEFCPIEKKRRGEIGSAVDVK